jgi:protein TonB
LTVAAPPLYRRLLGRMIIIACAAAVSGLTFGMAPWLVSGPLSDSLQKPLRVLAHFRPVPPPEIQEVEAPPPDPPPALKQPGRVKPDRISVSHTKPDLELTPPEIEFNPKLSKGPALTSPPAPPTPPKPAKPKVPPAPVDPAAPLSMQAKPAIAGPQAAIPAPAPSAGKLDHGPMATAQVPPMYPYSARRRGVEGWVKVRFLVNRQGGVEQLSILEAMPEGYFEESVMRSVSRWRYKPAVKHGHPRESWIETIIRFKLE